MSPPTQPDWTVLLVAGASGVGKSAVARSLGRRLGVPWLQVDDLRLALQHSRARLPTDVETAALYFFLDTPDVWELPPERLRDGLIATGEAMSPAIEVVIDHHVATASPIVIEGDGIVPSLLVRPLVRQYLADGSVCAICLHVPDEAVLLANMRARGRGFETMTEQQQRTEARTKQLYGQWLADEAGRAGVSLLAARPWETLFDRFLMVCGVNRVTIAPYRT